MCTTIKAYKGILLSANSFVDEDTGEIIEVLPYKNIYNKYRFKIPLHCYIQLNYTDKFCLIKDIIPIE